MNLRKIAPIGLASLLLLAGCHLDMYQQPKIKSQSENLLFSDSRGTRMPVMGTIEFGKPREDTVFYTGYSEDGKLARQFPIVIDEKVMARGRERFNIYCQHCHGAAGDGKGMIAQRGFALVRPIGNYHTDRLRQMPVGHFFDVITNGYGTMYGHASRIKPEDRWAIVAYIRALQFSQSADAADLDAESRAKFNLAGGPVNTGPMFVPAPNAPGTVPNPGPVEGRTIPQNQPPANGQGGNE